MEVSCTDGTSIWLDDNVSIVPSHEEDTQVMERESIPRIDSTIDPDVQPFCTSIPKPSKLASGNSKDEDGSASYVHCTKCTYSTKSRGNLSRHTMSIHVRRKFDCNDCEKRFSAAYDLKQHIRSFHLNGKFLCEYCSKLCNSRQAMYRHKSQDHNKVNDNNKYECSQCLKVFHEKAHYYGHMNTHRKLTPYNCRHCAKEFRYICSLRRHQKSCTGPSDKYVCRQCGVQMASADALRDHIQGKHGQKTFVCPCGKRFSWRSSFGRHQKKCRMCNL